MNEAQLYVQGKTWVELYEREDRHEILFTIYNLFFWLERDAADQLISSQEGLTWFRSSELVGSFPFGATLRPNPTISDMFRYVLKRDQYMAKIWREESDTSSLYTFFRI